MAVIPSDEFTGVVDVRGLALHDITISFANVPIAESGCGFGCDEGRPSESLRNHVGLLCLGADQDTHARGTKVPGFGVSPRFPANGECRLCQSDVSVGRYTLLELFDDLSSVVCTARDKVIALAFCGLVHDELFPPRKKLAVCPVLGAMGLSLHVP